MNSQVSLRTLVSFFDLRGKVIETRTVSDRTVQGLTVPKETDGFIFYDQLFIVLPYGEEQVELKSEVRNASKIHRRGQLADKDRMRELIAEYKHVIPDPDGMLAELERQPPEQQYVFRHVKNPSDGKHMAIELVYVRPFNPEKHVVVETTLV
jgi:hypothetical protein